MGGSFATRAAIAAAYLALVLVVSGWIGWASFRTGLNQLEQRGQADLSLASDRLQGQLQRFGELAVLLADHPALMAVLKGEGEAAGDAATAFLRRTADKTGSLDIRLADASGRLRVAAHSSTGADLRAAPYFQRAMDGALGAFHAVSAEFRRRVFTYSAPVFSEAGPVLGAVIVVIDIGAVEAEWRGDRPTVFFTDALGVVFVSNRSELLFQTRGELAPAPISSAAYGRDVLRPFLPHAARQVAGHTLWTLDGGPYLPSPALHLTRPLPVIGMRGEALLDIGPARDVALLQAAVAAALCLALGALLFLATERRRALAEANVALEARVAARGDELRKAQADLVQAGKLSALGQMSAGISHELNQPLMAIRSYAENAEAFLDRGKPEIAARNLARISDLARRMGRIIKNLRAFARQESEPVRTVDLVSVVETALEMSETKLARAGVALSWARPEAPVHVQGGEVRLAQVALNLIGNAVDAMEGQPDPRLDISIERGPTVHLIVRDRGPGIADPERIFDPFYSTKAVGQGDGMGLGLSISYGLVQGFGGAIRGENHPDGGAMFTVELTSADLEAAA